MYCNGCGRQIPADAALCPYCGLRVGVNMRPRLVRLRTDRKVAGVCSGVAAWFGWDASLVRIVWALASIVLFPLPIIVYAVMWVVVPEEPLAIPAVTTASTAPVSTPPSSSPPAY